MSKNDQEEAFERLLISTFSRIIEFVKFGEAKNAALLTFNSAWIIASVTFLFGSNPLTAPDWRFAFSITLPLFALSAIVSIVSFFPQIALWSFHRDPEGQKSLLFFGDISTFSPESYRDRIRDRYFPPADHSATQNYLDDLSVQINVNSSIALRKFTLFKGAAVITLVAISVIGFISLKSLWGYAVGS